MRMRLLFTPFELGALHLPNRIVMAPMTRCDAPAPAHAPSPDTVDHYAQRASAGLIITEGIAVSAGAHGYCDSPGLYTAAQVAGWKAVADAVHRNGGRIFAQLWHCGRVSHRSLQPDRGHPVGAGTQAADSKTLGCDPKSGRPTVVACSTPRALAAHEVESIVFDFAACASRALAAGFDGVEIQAGEGYLLDQFRCPFLNHRQDGYGGSLESRWRLTLDTCDAVAAAITPQRVGVRVSPLGIANDMRFDPDPDATYGYLAQELQRRHLAYLHLSDPVGSWAHNPNEPLLQHLRRQFAGALILCGGFDGERATAALAAHSADLIAFGRLYTSNPDLVERLEAEDALRPFDPRTFYRGRHRDMARRRAPLERRVQARP